MQMIWPAEALQIFHFMFRWQMTFLVSRREVPTAFALRYAWILMNAFSSYILWASCLRLVIFGGVSGGRPPRMGCAPAPGSSKVHHPLILLWAELYSSISSVHMLTAQLQGGLQFLQAAWMSLGFLLGQQSHDPSHQDCEWLHQWLAGRDNRWEKVVESSWSLSRLKNIRCNCYLPYLCVTDGARLQGHCWNVGIILCAHHFLAQPGAKPELWQIAMQSFGNVIAFKRFPEKMNSAFLTVTMHT